MSARQFAIELDKEWDATKQQMADAVSMIALQGLRLVVQRSPVDTGRFKGNWSLSVGEQNTTQSAMADPVGGNTIMNGATALRGYGSQGFHVIHIQNNLPYAQRLEDGWSKQAPAGMVGLTVPELQAMWNSLKL
jgi:hypothetical protein